MTIIFNVFLSLVFYERVVLLYLIPGHSHMIADQVVARNRGEIRGKNLYHPNQIASLCSETDCVEAEFLDHSKPFVPFFTEWENLLGKYFKNCQLSLQLITSLSSIMGLSLFVILQTLRIARPSPLTW